MALGNFHKMTCPPFFNVLNSDERLRMAEYEKACNEEQKQAIKNAFAWPISLIWGPPGTGKSHTGMQIAFWYAIYNQTRQDKSEDASDSETEMEEIQLPPSRKMSDSDGFQTVVHRRRRPQTRSSKQRQNVKCAGMAATPRDLDNTKFTFRFLNLQEEELKPLESRRRQVLYCGPSNTCVNGVAGKS